MKIKITGEPKEIAALVLDRAENTAENTETGIRSG